MRKFLICLTILVIFGLFIFFVGWTSIRVKPMQVGIVTSKTGGVSENPVVNGKFSWHKEFLLPANAILNCYTLEPLNVNKTVSGTLASGEAYTSVLGSVNNFSYEFNYSMNISVSEEDLVDLIKKNKVKTQEDLNNYLSVSGDVIAQLTTDYLLKKLEENPGFSVESIRRDDLTKALRIYQECPEVQLSLFAITSSKVPDYDLYKKVRNQIFNSDLINSRSYSTSNSTNLNNYDAESTTVDETAWQE